MYWIDPHSGLFRINMLPVVGHVHDLRETFSSMRGDVDDHEISMYAYIK